VKEPTIPSPVPSRTRGTGSTRAKAILVGEHAVVYGEPAIALPLASLPMRATARREEGPLVLESVLYSGTLADAPEVLAAPRAAIEATLDHLGLPHTGITLWTESTIPAAPGHGSSAATAGALALALADLAGRTLTAQEHFDLVQVGERVAHGNPSGLDARTTASTEPVWFQAGEIRSLDLRLQAHLVVADTGVHGRTRVAVADVRSFRERHPARGAELIAELGQITRDVVDDLALDRPTELGVRMTRAHRALAELGVSSVELDRLVDAALDAGALGAKLTGGGQGGCLLALATDADAAGKIAAALRRAGAARTWLHRTDVRLPSAPSAQVSPG
jgi:mevalonate kinase